MVSADVRDIYKDLKAEGRAVSIRVITVTGANPDIGDPGTETVVDYRTRAIEEELTYAERLRNAAILGHDIAMKDRRYMLAACCDYDAAVHDEDEGVIADGRALPELSSAMKLIDGTSTLQIIAPGPFRPASEVLYFQVQARGA